VDDTNIQVTAGEILEETLGEVELTVGRAARALIDASSGSRLSIDRNCHLLATTVGPISELIEAHRNKEIAVLVVFARAGIWASISGIPGEFLVHELSALFDGGGVNALCEGVVAARLVGVGHGSGGRKEDSEARYSEHCL
jgi:hypothetical protein